MSCHQDCHQTRKKHGARVSWNTTKLFYISITSWPKFCLVAINLWIFSKFPTKLILKIFAPFMLFLWSDWRFRFSSPLSSLMSPNNGLLLIDWFIYSLWAVFFWFFVCLLIFYWLPDIVLFKSLTLCYFLGSLPRNPHWDRSLSVLYTTAHESWDFPMLVVGRSTIPSLVWAGTSSTSGWYFL